MMQPKRTKYRKQFKGRNAGLAQRGSDVAFGEYGLKATEPCPHDGARDRSGTPRHDALHEARRQDLDPRVPGRAGHEEAARSAQGSGKGNVEYWVAKCSPARCCSRWKA